MHRTCWKVWCVFGVTVVAMLLVFWSGQVARAEVVTGSGVLIGSSNATHGPGFGGSGNSGGKRQPGGFAGSVEWERNSRRSRLDRNRWEENKGKRSSGGAARKRARAKKVAMHRPGGGDCGQGDSSEQDGEVKTDVKRRRAEQGDSQTPHVTTERIDDVPVLIGMMVKMGLPQVLDNNIPRHWKQRSLSWGWTATLWLAYIMSEGDHRKVVVREYVRSMKNSWKAIIGQEVDELDFTDDRLSILLNYLSREGYWRSIEEELGQNTIAAYNLPQDVVRCDATTVSVYHEPTEDGIMQFGNSKDDPSRPQVKIMMGSLDPLGMPLATDVVAGNRADDGLYAPIISRMNSILNKQGVLYVGDCKLGSLGNRAHIKSLEGYYLCPLPQTGETAKNMEQWITDGIMKDAENGLMELIVKDKKGEEEVKAKGYEFLRKQSDIVDDKEIVWDERVMIVNSPKYAQAQERGLEMRIQNATKKLLKLTPERGRGKKQITEESELVEAAQAILKRQAVEGLIEYEYRKEVERQEKYVGKGRGSSAREKQVIEKLRFVVTGVIRCEEAIKNQVKRFGWKVYVTDVSQSKLSLVDAIKCYRNEYRIEKIFSKLKSRYSIAPIYVKRDDQAKGLVNLLTLAVRVATLTEYVARQSLEKNRDTLTGLHMENPKKDTATPTYDRLLRAFSKMTLTIIEMGPNVVYHVTPLSSLQIKILELLGLDAEIYTNIAKFPNPMRC